MPVPTLTTIEEHVVLLVAGGRSHRQVADELGLSLRTVEWHAVRAGRKLEHAATLHDRIRRAAHDAPEPRQTRG